MTYMQQTVPIATRLWLLLALLLVIVDLYAEKDAPFHHRSHNNAVEFAKEFASGVDILSNYDIRIIVNHHTIHVVISADGQAMVAL